MEIDLNLEQRVRLGYGYLKYLQEKSPEYFVTLTYRERYSDQPSEDAMRAFVRKLATRLPRQTRHDFGGLVCAERHDTGKFEGCYHFHFLLWGLDAGLYDAADWLEQNVVRAASELYPRVAGPRCDCAQAKALRKKKNCPGGLTCRGPQMSGKSWVRTRKIETLPEVVHEYTIEDVYRMDRPAGSQILDIGPCGLTSSLLREELM